MAAVESAANAILLTDREGVLLWANPAFTALTGYSFSEVSGDRPGDCEWRPPRSFPDVWQQMLTGRPWTGRAWNRRKDASTFLEETTLAPIRAASGAVSHFLIFQRDVLAREEADPALPSEYQHQQSTSELEEQLRRAQRMEAVGQLAGGAAHDFNNLLTVINGYSDLLLSRREPEELAHRYLQLIRNAGERATTLAARMLAFSRHNVEQPVILNLNDVVADLGTLLKRLLPASVDLVHKLEPRLDSVLADVGLMEQVLMNLVINARDALADGGTIVMETANLEAAAGSVSGPPGRYVVLTIADTGTGMDESTKAHLFEPFFTTKPSGMGTGLGLCTVDRIVKQSAGWISIQSEPGKGTSVSVYLPAAAGNAAPEADPAPIRPRRFSHEPGSGTILLVDDSEEVLWFSASVLEDFGYTVLTSSNGAEALHWAQTFENPIDLLIIDLVLPDGNGPDIAEQLSSVRPGLAVLFVSGYPSQVAAGGEIPRRQPEFLAKPFSADVLGVRVQEVLRQRYHRRILIIDDNPELLAFASRTLSDAGFDVHTAWNGSRAAALVREHALDLVITDLVMPESEGLETIRALRHEYPSLPIIAISGAYEGKFLKHALRFGVQAAIAKPFTGRDLLDTVRRTLGIGARRAGN